MSLIVEFTEKVLNTEDSFSISLKHKEDSKDISCYFFIQGKVGNARYVYGINSWNDDTFYAGIDKKPELVAIVCDNTVYIVDEIFLKTYRYFGGVNTIELPANVRRFDEVVTEMNRYAIDKYFSEFYESLESEEITEEYVLNDCKKKAREYLFAKEQLTVFEDEVPANIFTTDDIAKIICGFMNMEEETNRRLIEKKDKWVDVKSISGKIREYMKLPDTVLDWEMDIAGGLRSIDAKTVTVEFEMNGKKASGKISPRVIRNALETNDYFCSFNFEVCKQGEALIKALNAGQHHWDDNVLRCTHITKITYGKKVLYERNN